MSKIRIDTKVLSQEALKIRNISVRLNDLLSELRKQNSVLQDNWETRTSRELYGNLPLFYQMLENMKEDNDNIACFLEKTCQHYQNLDNSISSSVDKNIAV